uniref:protein-histidine N-methyltransferase n=1 Tax=Daphnia similis TaxID=35528 RepID=A0A4Y7LQX1_9CRUS|nr:EOG090X0C09 [Daphnia similis]SVE71903.1 EOG090X0C09 [Daphnia similis]
MFKFNFPSENQNETDTISDHLNSSDKTSLQEIDGQEIEISNDHFQNIKQYRESCSPTSLVRGFHLVDLKHVEELVTSQKSAEFESLKTAIQMNSDVISGVYEGGLKIWECTLDLLDYLNKESIQFDRLDVLDLGCGSGLLGMHALRKGAQSVHFQDYNAEVLSLCTIPNVILNNNPDVNSKTKFFAGDWGSLHHKLKSYDIILTSETIYNPENYRKLIKIFEEMINKNGVIYVAAKHFYFGVGGNIYEFEKLLRQNERWNTSICFCSAEGVKREILKIVQSADKNHYKEQKYDLSASQFSPDGRVFQVEYAQKAVENSGSSSRRSFSFLREENSLNIRQHTTLSNGNSRKEFVQFFVITDGQL